MLSFVSNYIVLGGIAAQAGYVCGQLMDNSPLGTHEFMFLGLLLSFSVWQVALPCGVCLLWVCQGLAGCYST